MTGMDDAIRRRREEQRAAEATRREQEADLSRQVQQRQQAESMRDDLNRRVWTAIANDLKARGVPKDQKVAIGNTRRTIVRESRVRYKKGWTIRSFNAEGSTGWGGSVDYIARDVLLPDGRVFSTTGVYNNRETIYSLEMLADAAISMVAERGMTWPASAPDVSQYLE